MFIQIFTPKAGSVLGLVLFPIVKQFYFLWKHKVSNILRINVDGILEEI